MEFFGVVRFYFYGPNDKYYSKCVRISSEATARHLVNVLVEKFHPDLRLLKSGRYAIYEYHPSFGGKCKHVDRTQFLVLLWCALTLSSLFDRIRSCVTSIEVLYTQNYIGMKTYYVLNRFGVTHLPFLSPNVYGTVEISQCHLKLKRFIWKNWKMQLISYDFICCNHITVCML